MAWFLVASLVLLASRTGDTRVIFAPTYGVVAACAGEIALRPKVLNATTARVAVSFFQESFILSFRRAHHRHVLMSKGKPVKAVSVSGFTKSLLFRY
jgi:hypothetical protein